MHGEDDKIHTKFARKLEEKTILGKLKSRWEDTIKFNLKNKM
jgi:hypothetical protein